MSCCQKKVVSSCCGVNPEKVEGGIKEEVKKGYSLVAKNVGSCCGPSLLPIDSKALAEKIGYREEELQGEGNMGLSCGNPTAIAGLKLGDVVLDLGSGGGFDCFIAGEKVGEMGKVIGVDMTQEMIDLAQKNAERYTKRTGLKNVEFRFGEIENLPVGDGEVDVVISNCVINLSEDKEKVWKEIKRVLKPGGKVVASDVALKKILPKGVKENVSALIGCISGAVLVQDYLEMVKKAGLIDVIVKEKKDYVEALEGMGEDWGLGEKIGEYVVSVDVVATRL